MQNISLSLFQRKLVLFYIGVLVFNILQLLWFKNVFIIDQLISDLLFVVVIIFELRAYYPNFRNKNRVVVASLITSFVLMSYKAWAVAIPGQTETVRTSSGRPSEIMMNETLLVDAVVLQFTMQVLVHGMFEIFWRMDSGVPLTWNGAEATSSITMMTSLNDNGEKKTVEKKLVESASKDSINLSKNLYDPRPSNFHPPNSIFTPPAILIPLINIFNGTYLPTIGVGTYETWQMIQFCQLVLFALWAFYDSWRSPIPIRNGRGYISMAMVSPTGAGSFVITMNFLASASKDSGTLAVFVAYTILMTLIILLFWKMSKLGSDSYRCLPFIFPFQTVDDLFADSIFLGSQSNGFTVWTALITVVLITRLVLRDVGYFEIALNNIRDRMFGNPSDKYIDEMQSDQEREHYDLHVRIQHARKYWLYSAQDLLSEHLSVVILPVLLTFDRWLGGYCLFTCSFSEGETWGLVLSFGVLLIVKMICNEIVHRLTFRKMTAIEQDVNGYIARYGAIDKWSPLNMWAEYDIDDDLMEKPLAEQCQIVKERHIEKHYIYFFACVASASTLALAIGAQIVVL